MTINPVWKELKTITVRLPLPVYEEIKRISQGSGRSINDYIRSALAGHLYMEDPGLKRHRPAVRNGVYQGLNDQPRCELMLDDQETQCGLPAKHDKACLGKPPCCEARGPLGQECDNPWYHNDLHSSLWLWGKV